MAYKLPAEGDRGATANQAVIVAAVIGAIGAITAAIIGLLSHSSEGTPHPSTDHPSTAPDQSAVAAPSSLPSGLRLGTLVMTKHTLCSWRKGRPVPLTSAQPLRLRIDDRCNDPRDPSPVTDSPTGVYKAASQHSRLVGRVRDGQLITIMCFVSQGDRIRDAVGNASAIWLRLDAPAGLLPNVDVGGGFTLAQLHALGVTAC